MSTVSASSTAERLAARIEVVTERAALTDYVDNLRSSIEARITLVESAIGGLGERKKEIDTLFLSLRQAAQEVDETSIAKRIESLETENSELRLTIEALRKDIREAVTYLGSTTHTRLTTLGGSIDNLNSRTNRLEVNAGVVADRLSRYFNIWPIGSLRRLRRKIRKLPESQF